MAVTGPTPEQQALLRDDDLAEIRERIGSFLRETVERAAADGVVVAMDGEVGSTLTAALAVEALGADRVVGLLLPCTKSSEPGVVDAGTFAEALGIEHHRVQLTPLYEAFRETVGTALEEATTGGPDGSRRAHGNVVERLRMATAYFVANARNLLVLGSANRTELLLGTVTKHGDAGVDAFPLGNLYETEVRDLAREVGIPRRIVERTAGETPWSEETAVDDLEVGYRTVDEVLRAVVDDDLTPRTAAKALDAPVDDVRFVMERWVDSEHKRRYPARPGEDGPRWQY